MIGGNSRVDYQIMKKQKAFPPNLQQWVDARKQFHLSHKQIQMARELGLNPKKFGKLANHKQEPWKEPLPNFIESLYLKRYSRLEPAKISTIQELFELELQKKRKRQETRIRAKAAKLAVITHPG